jgi:hypothetical protein
LGFVEVLVHGCKHCKLRRISLRHGPAGDFGTALDKRKNAVRRRQYQYFVCSQFAKIRGTTQQQSRMAFCGLRANRANVSLEEHGGRNVTGIVADSVPLELDYPLAKVTTSFCQHRKLQENTMA